MKLLYNAILLIMISCFVGCTSDSMTTDTSDTSTTEQNNEANEETGTKQLLMVEDFDETGKLTNKQEYTYTSDGYYYLWYIYSLSDKPYRKEECKKGPSENTHTSYLYTEGNWTNLGSDKYIYTDSTKKKIKSVEYYDSNGGMTCREEYTYNNDGYNFIIRYDGDHSTIPSMKFERLDNPICQLASKTYVYISGEWSIYSSTEYTFTDASKKSLKTVKSYDSTGKLTERYEYTYTSNGFSYLLYDASDTPIRKYEEIDEEKKTTQKYYNYSEGKWVLYHTTEWTYEIIKQ